MGALALAGFGIAWLNKQTAVKTSGSTLVQLVLTNVNGHSSPQVSGQNQSSPEHHLLQPGTSRSGNRIWMV